MWASARGREDQIRRRACGQRRARWILSKVQKVQVRWMFSSHDYDWWTELTACSYGRGSLATSQFILPHTARPSHKQFQPIDVAGPTSSPDCAHYFVDPLSWMRPELEQGKLDGRLECPKCQTNVGKYAWQGMRCSCGEWVIPAITLAKARIDEFKNVARGPGGMGIRMPPGGGQNL